MSFYVTPPAVLTIKLHFTYLIIIKAELYTIEAFMLSMLNVYFSNTKLNSVYGISPNLAPS